MAEMLNYMLSEYADLPLPREILRNWLEKWIYEQEKRCADKNFSARFPWNETGLPQEYFLQRKLSIDGRQFLTGPRYQGGDINRPFIDIVGSNSDIDHSVLKAVSKEWAHLKPQHIRILMSGHHKVQGITDQLIYASCLSDVPEYRDDTLKIAPAVYADLKWCRQALAEAYQHTFLTVPALKNNLYSMEEDELSNHILEGDVYIFQEYGIRVGLIICGKGEIAFLQGYRISEEVILPTFRGRSLASRAQRLLCNHLYRSSRKTPLITGTIIPGNVPSIKTAERAGRTCILKYQFLPVIFS